MLQNNIINNINIDDLPEDVVEAILDEFNELGVHEKLIIYSRLVHGNLFKSERVDLFKINKVSISQIYDNFINKIKFKLVGS